MGSSAGECCLCLQVTSGTKVNGASIVPTATINKYPMLLLLTAENKKCGGKTGSNATMAMPSFVKRKQLVQQLQ
jgi:hypothetical protein